MKENKRYFTAKQLFNKIYRLNALSKNAGWDKVKSSKNRTDIFGDGINAREYYYRFKIGEDRSDDLKLSEKSMDRFIYVLFTTNPEIEELSRVFLKDKFDTVRNIINKNRKGEEE
jgi:hypothetical protein